jgi:hypothetical protein
MNIPWRCYTGWLSAVQGNIDVGEYQEIHKCTARAKKNVEIFSVKAEGMFSDHRAV